MPNFDPEQKSNWVSDRRDENPLRRFGASLAGLGEEYKQMWRNSIGGHLMGLDTPKIDQSGVIPGGPDSQLAKALGINMISGVNPAKLTPGTRAKWEEMRRQQREESQ